jgi:transposase InsO family protein
LLVGLSQRRRDRRIHDMLRLHFPGVNHKKVYRLYSAANLAVRKRKMAKRPVSERVPLQLASTVNEVWSMDFVSDSLSTCGTTLFFRQRAIELSSLGAESRSIGAPAWHGTA